MAHRLSSGLISGIHDLSANLLLIPGMVMTTYCLDSPGQAAAMMQLTAGLMKRSLYLSPQPVPFAPNHHDFRFTTSIRVDFNYHRADGGGVRLGLDLDAVFS